MKTENGTSNENGARVENGRKKREGILYPYFRSPLQVTLLYILNTTYWWICAKIHNNRLS